MESFSPAWGGAIRSAQHFGLGLLDPRYFRFPRLVQLRSCFFSSDGVAGLLADWNQKTRPPAASIRAFASSRVRSGMVQVSTNVRPSSRDDFRFFSAVKRKPAWRSFSTK